MTLLTVVVAVGFLGCWFFLRQIAFYLVRCAAELEQIDASLTVVTIRIESLHSPLKEIEAHLKTNRLPEP
jgi:hypothetical protein